MNRNVLKYNLKERLGLFSALFLRHTICIYKTSNVVIAFTMGKNNGGGMNHPCLQTLRQHKGEKW